MLHTDSHRLKRRRRFSILLALAAVLCTSLAFAQDATEAMLDAAGVPKVAAFLPDQYSVAKTEALPIDGVWRVNTINKKIRIEQGRAFALDPWRHLFVLQVTPGMVVLQNFRRTGIGTYSADDDAVTPEAQAAPAKRPATTAASATRVRPSPSRSQYRRTASPRQAAANQAARATRSSSGRSATARPAAIALPGSPLTSWSAWNRASQPARGAAPERRQRQSPSGMQVSFRAERASVQLTRIQRNPQTGEITGGGGVL